MNSNQKIVLLIAAALLIGIFTWWLTSGGEVLSKDGIWVEKEMTELDKALGLKPELEFHEKSLIRHTIPAFERTSGNFSGNSGRC